MQYFIKSFVHFSDLVYKIVKKDLSPPCRLLALFLAVLY
nr:MAG TPA: hypothetical protein [Caudoviricetes sp.]